MHTTNVSRIAFAPALANILFYSHYRRLVEMNGNIRENCESGVTTKSYVQTLVKTIE